MAERWQQWMPLHIDKFRGSPEVQAMHPAARAGYLYILASMWQTDDCTVSSDPMDLATESGLGDELWALYGPRIIRKFEVIEGRLRNAVLFSEWSEARDVFNKRRAGAVRTNSVRSPHAERTQSERSADTQTLTGTETTTEAKTTTAKTPQSGFVLPDWIDSRSWKGYEEMRRRKRAPLTDHARELSVKKLSLLAAQGHDPTEILNNSIMNGWQGLFAPTGGGGNGSNQQNRGRDRVNQQLEELAKAGVVFAPGGAEESSGQDGDPARGGHGRDAPGVVLEGAR